MPRSKKDRIIKFGTATMVDVKTSTYKGVTLVHSKRSDRDDVYRIRSDKNPIFVVSGSDIEDAVSRAKRCVDRFFDYLESDRLRRNIRR